MIFKNYLKCVFCNSKNLKKAKDQSFELNFYLKSIKSDFNINLKKISEAKVYKCQRCKIIQNNPWFTETDARKIFSNIYGQHNRGWSNLLNFFEKKTLPNHGLLFNYLNRKIKIKNYAEFNSPFMGLMLNFFEREYKKNNFFYKKILNSTLNYLSSRQVVGQSIIKKRLAEINAKKYLRLNISLKKKNLINKKINKSLYIDNSSLSWGQNDNYKSVNSKSLASELLDLKIFDISRKNNLQKFDLFGIFHTLDHTFEPSKILNFALDNSKYVVVYCHVNENLEKQHLFSFTREFLGYLKKKNVYTLDLTDIIKKNYSVPEMYFVCSKNKDLIKKITYEKKK